MRKKIICILCLTLLLSGCGSSKSEEPFPTGGQRPGIPTTPQPTATPTPSPQPTATSTVTPSPTPTVSPTPTLIPGARIAGWRKVEEVEWYGQEKPRKTMWKYDKDGAEILVEEYVGNQLIQRTATIYWGRGKIETQISSSFDATGMVGWNEEKYSYDMAGNCVRYSRTSYNQANTVTSWDVTEYEYDKNGVLKKMVLTNEDGVYLHSSYDEEGRTILEEYFENGVAYGTTVYRYPDSYSERADWEFSDGRTGYEIQKFDKQGRKIRREWCSEGIFIYFACEYGEHGLLWEEKTNEEGEGIVRKEYVYRADGKLINEKRYENERQISEVRYTYNEKGEMIKKESKSEEDIYIDYYVYDDTGNLLEETSSDGTKRLYVYNDDGKLVSKSNGSIKYMYDYDDYGNMIQQEEYEEGQTAFLRRALYCYEPIYDMGIGN